MCLPFEDELSFDEICLLCSQNDYKGIKNKVTLRRCTIEVFSYCTFDSDFEDTLDFVISFRTVSEDGNVLDSGVRSSVVSWEFISGVVADIVRYQALLYD